MLSNTGIEYERNGLINCQFLTRSISGDKCLVTIVSHEGNIAHLTDELGFNYKLPENVLVTLAPSIQDEKTMNSFYQKNPFPNFVPMDGGGFIEEIDDVKDYSNKSDKMTLKSIFDNGGKAQVINYLGEKMNIEIEKIEKARYGWPLDELDFQEGNLIISV